MRPMRRWAAFVLVFAAAGCGRSVLLPVGEGGGGGEPTNDDCPSGVRLGGVCPGVTVEGRCHDAPWVSKMSCDDVVAVWASSG